MTQRVFDPSRDIGHPPPAHDSNPDGGAHLYVFDNPDLVLSVNVALVTGRPLLLRGPSGCGKSSLARAVAWHLGWRMIEPYVVTSSTQWRDLCWKYDAVARFADAQIDGRRDRAMEPGHYVSRGVLWEAFRPAQTVAGTVVLIDEIDKAEPNVPNDLLVPLGNRRFTVEETREVVFQEQPKQPDIRMPFGPLLMVITENNERDLPQAFLRRCISITIPPPTKDHLVAVAGAHFPELPQSRQHLVERIAELFVPDSGVSGEGQDDRATRPGSVAEFIDAVRALGVLAEESDAPDIERVLGLIHNRPVVEQ